MNKFPFLVAVIGLSSATVSGAEIPQVATQAKAVLEKHCYECHGKNGSNEGNLNFILNRDRLVSSKKVVPGEPGDSLLLKRVRSEDMPPDRDNNGKKITDRPTPEELATLRKWIEAGAPDFKLAEAPRKFISNTDVFEVIYQDQIKAPERSRRFLRYFTITHLYNAGMTEDELQSYRAGLSKLINSLSWGTKIVVPQPVDPMQTAFRIDLRDYAWDSTTWDRLVEANPYGVTFNTPKAKVVYEVAGTQLPALRADWFVFVASRPPLYHDLLKLKATEAELENRLGIDTASNIRNERVARAGFNGSGISKNNRIIERHEASYGAYWRGIDFAGNVDQKNIFQFPLGPGESDKLFKHDGGEIIFNLPNGLQGYLLVNANGKRIDKAPDFVRDKKQGDSAVVNGISCMSCHSKGIIPATDQIRKHVENNSSAFSKADADTILSLYPPQTELKALYEQDANRFREAVLATGATLSQTEPVFALAGGFERALDLTQTAAEVGITPTEFLVGLDHAPALARIFGPLRNDVGTIQREVLVAHFGELVKAVLPDGIHLAAKPIQSAPPEVANAKAQPEATKPGEKADEDEKEKAARIEPFRSMVISKEIDASKLEEGPILKTQLEVKKKKLGDVTYSWITPTKDSGGFVDELPASKSGIGVEFLLTQDFSGDIDIGFSKLRIDVDSRFPILASVFFESERIQLRTTRWRDNELNLVSLVVREKDLDLWINGRFVQKFRDDDLNPTKYGMTIRQKDNGFVRHRLYIPEADPKQK